MLQNNVRFLYNCVALQYVENNKAADNDWFRLESNKEGTRSVLLPFFVLGALIFSLISCYLFCVGGLESAGIFTSF